MNKIPYIDPDALYTLDACARKVMQMDPSLTFEEARRKVTDAIDKGIIHPVTATLNTR